MSTLNTRGPDRVRRCEAPAFCRAIHAAWPPPLLRVRSQASGLMPNGGSAFPSVQASLSSMCRCRLYGLIPHRRHGRHGSSGSGVDVGSGGQMPEPLAVFPESSAPHLKCRSCVRRPLYCALVDAARLGRLNRELGFERPRLTVSYQLGDEGRRVVWVLPLGTIAGWSRASASRLTAPRSHPGGHPASGTPLKLANERGSISARPQSCDRDRSGRDIGHCLRGWRSAEHDRELAEL